MIIPIIVWVDDMAGSLLHPVTIITVACLVHLLCTETRNISFLNSDRDLI